MSKFENYLKFISEESTINFNYISSYGDHTFDLEYYPQSKKKKSRFEKKFKSTPNKASEVKLDSTDSIKI